MGRARTKHRQDWVLLIRLAIVATSITCLWKLPAVVDFFARLHQGMRIAFHGERSQLEVPYEHPDVTYERTVQETREFLQRLRLAHQEYFSLRSKLMEHDARFRFGESSFPRGMAGQWINRRDHHRLGYTTDDLETFERDFGRAVQAREQGRATAEDRKVLPYLHQYTGKLLGIPFDETTQRYASNLKAVQRDAPEVVVDEFRVLLRRADGHLPAIQSTDRAPDE